MRRAALVVLLCAGTLSAQAIRGNAGFRSTVLERNDDGSTGAVPIGFTVNFFGKTRNTLFVNNNGNVTFDSALATFTPFGLTSTQREIIAAFFGDVDTRDARSALVTYGRDSINGRPAFGVNYLNVGYFSNHSDKLNSFQLILIQRADTGESNFDIEFNYSRIAWETGDASGGTNGFGGTPAAVGWSNGTGDTGTFFELDGSLQTGAFLDNGRRSLIRNRLNSSVAGRYVFRARGGTILPPLGIATGCPLPTAQINAPYSVALRAAGDGTNLRWSLLPDPGASLPPGINLTGSTIAGTPTASGTTAFTIQLIATTEEGDQTVSRRCTLTVAPPQLSITSGCPLPPATAGQAYNTPLQVSGGRAPYTWRLADGSGPLPSGLSLSGSGVISGVPVADGTFPLLVQVSSNPADGSEPVTRACNLTVNAAVLRLSSSCSLPDATVGVPYTQTLSVNGGSAPFTFGAPSGLPLGMALSSNGRISGIPTGSGNIRFAVQITDAAGTSVAQTCSLNISTPAVSVDTACPLAPGVVGQNYSQRLTASGGSGPYTFSTLSALPSGLAISNDGVVSGTPGAAGAASFRLLVSDSRGNAAAKSCSVLIAPSSFSLSSCPLPIATVGERYSQRLDVQGGEDPYIFTANGGFPGGLTLTSMGLLSGVPTAAGTFPLNVRVQDRFGRATSQPCGLVVEPSSLNIAGTCPVTQVRVGSAVNTRFTVSGGSEPYIFTVSRPLPQGLSLSSNGVLSGTPAGAGTTDFNLMVQDSQGRLVSRDCSIEVAQAVLPAMRILDLPSSLAPASAGPTVTFELGQASTLPVEGTLALKFTPDTGNPDAAVDQGDPRVRFLNGNTSASFTLPPGTRQFSIPIVSSGTVAGTISVSVASLRVGNSPVTLLPPARLITIRRAAPVVTSACLSTASGLSAIVTGYTTTRGLNSADFTFAHPTGGAEEKVKVDLTGTSADYFGSDTSIRNGGAFTLTIPFTVEGGPVSTGSMVLTNREGSSAAINLTRCN